MDDTLNPEEQKVFEQMQKQEAEEVQIIKQEKGDPNALPQTQTQGDQQQQTEEGKTVPVSAVAEERERRRAAEERARTAELNQARLDERLKMIDQRLNPPQAEQEIPDPEKDAMAALKFTTEEARAFREWRQGQAQQNENQRIVQDVMNRAAQQEVAFEKDTPDYRQAGDFLKNSRYQELVSLGQSPMEAQQTMQQEAVQLAAVALKQGKNPAEVVYNLAKLRGYSRATSVQQAQPETDADKLARINQGQRQNMSLGNVNAAPPKQPLDSKQLLAMDDDQFAKWLDKLPVSERAKYLGA